MEQYIKKEFCYSLYDSSGCVGLQPNRLAHIIAQLAISYYTQIASNIKNKTWNNDIIVMIAHDTGRVSKYDDLYQGLKPSEYGKEMHDAVNICHHNTHIMDSMKGYKVELIH